MIREGKQYDQQGNIAGSVAKMEIDPTAFAHIMSIMTDLYKDAQLAVIREYSTNALDAHVEAGVTKPIEVTTPSTLSPFFKVKDYGCGLTQEDIHNIYSKYGASTKRGTNSQVGMLGIGCKSALTYASQFTVTSCKDGRKIAVSISRDEDGGGSMTIVSDEPTTEPDGTEILVPARQGNEFDTKAKRFFRWWPEGSVLLNGKPPKRFNGLRLDDELWIVEADEDEDEDASYHRRYRYGYQQQREADSDKVVMGNVAYPCTIDGLPYGVQLVAFVPIGAVNFTPAREALMVDDPVTKATLARIAADYKVKVRGALQREMDNAKTASDALGLLADWQDKLGKGNDTFTWNGNDLPTELEAPKRPNSGSATNFTTSAADSRYGGLGVSSSMRAIPAVSWPKCLFVEGFEVEYAADHKRKMLKYCEDKGITPVETFVCTWGKIDRNAFIEDRRIVSYKDDILPIRLNPNKPGATGPSGKKYRGSYSGYVNGTHHREIQGSTIDTTAPVLWMQGSYYSGRSEMAQVQGLGITKFTLLVLPQNRIAKFVRENTEAQKVQDFINAKFAEWFGSLSQDTKDAIALQSGGMVGRRYGHRVNHTALLRAFDETRIDDPDLSKGILLAKKNVKNELETLSRFGYREVKMVHKLPLDRYPLIVPPGNLNGNRDHLYDYLNWTYSNHNAATAADGGDA